MPEISYREKILNGSPEGGYRFFNDGSHAGGSTMRLPYGFNFALRVHAPTPDACENDVIHPVAVWISQHRIVTISEIIEAPENLPNVIS